MASIDSNNIFRLEVKRPSVNGVVQSEVVNLVTDYDFMENKPLVFKSRSDFPTEGKEINLYIATNEDKIYRWNGTEYVLLTLKINDLTSKFVTLDTDQTITGQKTFTQKIIGNLQGTADWADYAHNSDKVDGLHMNPWSYAYASQSTITFGANSKLAGTVTWSQLLAMTGYRYGEFYYVSDKNQYWRRRTTSTSACTNSNYNDYWLECTNEYAAALQQTQIDNDDNFIYLKLNTATPYTSLLCKFFTEANYDNTGGTSLLNGYCRQKNEWEINSSSYNGNNLVGVYQSTNNTDIYYFKFYNYRSSYGAEPSLSFSISIQSNFGTTSLTYINKAHSEYSTISTLPYVDVPQYGYNTTKIWGTLLPRYGNTYDLGSSDYKWRNIYGTLKGNADSATSAGNADTLDNQHGTYYLNWNNFTNIPDVIDGGDLDTATT